MHLVFAFQIEHFRMGSLDWGRHKEEEEEEKKLQEFQFQEFSTRANSISKSSVACLLSFFHVQFRNVMSKETKKKNINKKKRS